MGSTVESNVASIASTLASNMARAMDAETPSIYVDAQGVARFSIGAPLGSFTVTVTEDDE